MLDNSHIVAFPAALRGNHCCRAVRSHVHAADISFIGFQFGKPVRHFCRPGCTLIFRYEHPCGFVHDHQAAVRQPAHAAGLLQLFGQVDLFLHIPAHGHRAVSAGRPGRTVLLLFPGSVRAAGRFLFSACCTSRAATRHGKNHGSRQQKTARFFQIPFQHILLFLSMNLVTVQITVPLRFGFFFYHYSAI